MIRVYSFHVVPLITTANIVFLTMIGRQQVSPLLLMAELRVRNLNIFYLIAACVKTHVAGNSYMFENGTISRADKLLCVSRRGAQIASRRNPYRLETRKMLVPRCLSGPFHNGIRPVKKPDASDIYVSPRLVPRTPAISFCDSGITGRRPL